jgi:hypothetical protein
MEKSLKRHLDGTRCKEGTRKVPRNFRPCCGMFAGHVTTCDYDLRYEWWAGDRVWVITIAESAGGGGVEVRFCPHCGAELEPRSKPPKPEGLGGQPGRRMRIT